MMDSCSFTNRSIVSRMLLATWQLSFPCEQDVALLKQSFGAVQLAEDRKSCQQPHQISGSVLELGRIQARAGTRIAALIHCP
jgi:hypothetical protein